MMRFYKELFQTAFFNLGFWVSAAVFLILNLIPHKKETSGLITKFAHYHCYHKAGFPFESYRIDSCYGIQFDILDASFIADVLIGVGFCFACGLLCKMFGEAISKPGNK